MVPTPCRFAIIIIGAGVTRYAGFEGTMHIREGDSSNYIFSDQTYLNVRANDGVQDYSIDQLLTFGMLTDNSFKVDLKTANKGTVEISYKNYLKKIVKKNIMLPTLCMWMHTNIGLPNIPHLPRSW